jgi:hypothetical protein
MSEASYVELPVIAWLSGQGSHTPGDKGLGWTYRDEAAMAAFNRPLTDPLVGAPRNQGAKVRRQRPAVELGAHSQASNGRKLQRLWGRLGHGRPRFASPKCYWRNAHYIN